MFLGEADYRPGEPTDNADIDALGAGSSACRDEAEQAANVVVRLAGRPRGLPLGGVYAASSSSSSSASRSSASRTRSLRTALAARFALRRT